MAETELQAATDSLTGLLNRRSLENRARMLRDARTSCAVVMADLDYFKELNDTHGHETADRALRVFSETLRGALRAEDLVERHSGEEFAVVLPACTAEDARTAIEQARLRRTRRRDLARRVVRASERYRTFALAGVGAAWSGDDAIGADTLIARVASPAKELDALPGGLDVSVVVEILEHEHQVSLDDRVGASQGPPTSWGDGVNHASAVGWIDAAREVTLVDERVDESGRALFRDRQLKRQVRLDRVAVLEKLQDSILGTRQPGFFEREFREAGKPHDGVTERRVLDERVGHLLSAMTIDLWCRHGAGA